MPLTISSSRECSSQHAREIGDAAEHRQAGRVAVGRENADELVVDAAAAEPERAAQRDEPLAVADEHRAPPRARDPPDVRRDHLVAGAEQRDHDRADHERGDVEPEGRVLVAGAERERERDHHDEQQRRDDPPGARRAAPAARTTRRARRRAPSRARGTAASSSPRPRAGPRGSAARRSRAPAGRARGRASRRARDRSMTTSATMLTARRACARSCPPEGRILADRMSEAYSGRPGGAASPSPALSTSERPPPTTGLVATRAAIVPPFRQDPVGGGGTLGRRADTHRRSRPRSRDGAPAPGRAAARAQLDHHGRTWTRGIRSRGRISPPGRTASSRGTRRRTPSRCTGGSSSRSTGSSAATGTSSGWLRSSSPSARR